MRKPHAVVGAKNATAKAGTISANTMIPTADDAEALTVAEIALTPREEL
jgi:hypothetical protein